MPDKKGRNTAQETVFIDRMVATNDRVYAAEKAGYAQPGAAASQVLARPAVQAEIRAAQLARLNNELLPLALNVLEHVLTSTDAKVGTRDKIMAAKIVVDKTTGASDPADAKEPHEMTAEELQRRIDQLRREAADRASPVLDLEANDQAEPSVFD